MAYCLGFAGYSDSGKTTLIARLLVEMKYRGHRIGVMKHDAHGHYKEVQGADSTVFVERDADVVVTISPNALHVYEKMESPCLEEQLAAYDHLDYIFIEGFKKEKHPKIGVYRTIEQKELLKGLAPSLIAVATDLTNVDDDLALPRLNLNDIRGIADFIEQFFVNCQF
ncbi:molybdopterin-guanine dinucleotide biosynthesis protein B [Paenibacillus oryzisoli]|uniref:Molybdopterin-guanine dinucleotide biosynthesis protein B n=1 Tax=Paenibacillus oryzisoli TaxID=1850517 RepID=A0A198AM61_9BACL|nr:molybdopterin-guanine dinucleotide biosynthesis protein B [Paenibacillus oryzisoli]OAS22347.1 molybdopterin-guanine dinucleotide biosynthesis protein B [Paenibacillus oryzisoli]